ncbi:MAG: LysR family transcriptional regulator [Pseudomonadota bacterium]
MPITFRQLEIFVAAASDCNFRCTADRLGVSQPSISNQIRALEEQVGKRLFERRRGSPPMLSPEGIQYLEKARELVQGRQDMERQARDQPGSRSVRLTVTAGLLLLDAYIRPRLPAFCESHPNILLDFVPLHPTRGAAPMVLSGEVDLAVFTGDFLVDQRLESEIIDTVGCSIYASPALARRVSRAGGKLSDLPFLMPPAEYRPTRWMYRALKDAGVELRNIIARSQFPDVISNMAIEGRGAAVLFDHFATQGVTEGKLVRIGPPLASTQRVLLIGARAKRPAAQPAVDLFRQATRSLDTSSGMTQRQR